MEEGAPRWCCARCLILSFCVTDLFSNLTLLSAAEGGKGKDMPAVHWLRDYGDAITAASQQNKMLLIYFHDSSSDSPCKRFRGRRSMIHKCKLSCGTMYACGPIDAKITVQGKQVVLIEHAAFQDMLGRPGIAIVDYRSNGALRGCAVSEFPLTETLWYTPEQMAVILTLPPGTLTQRTMIYAVRIHPEHPASTDGKPNPTLLEEAESHSQYQADIRVQGHHFWGTRFARILSRLPGVGARGEGGRELGWPGLGRSGHRVRSLLAALLRPLEPPSARRAVSSATT